MIDPETQTCPTAERDDPRNPEPLPSCEKNTGTSRAPGEGGVPKDIKCLYRVFLIERIRSLMVIMSAYHICRNSSLPKIWLAIFAPKPGGFDTSDRWSISSMDWMCEAVVPVCVMAKKQPALSPVFDIS